MSDALPAWAQLLTSVAEAFTRPSFELFRELICAWVLCPGRHTITRMISLVDSEHARAHDAYHRLVREGAWLLTPLWKGLASILVARLRRQGAGVVLLLDDTLFHKTGPKVEGAGIFRDAVRSTRRHVVYARGLNLIVLALRISPPWGGEPLALPINLRLYRKGGPTHLDLAEEMSEEVAAWFPSLGFRLVCDGAYASLAGRQHPRSVVISRMRRDAALYDPPPPRKKGQRGRPRKKGRRLPTPQQMARAKRRRWRRYSFQMRGKKVVRLLLQRNVIWHKVCPGRLLKLVIVRDPDGKQKDDFFFSTSTTTAAADVASLYADRWSIEDTFRNTKQFLGGEHPQTWKGEGPAKAAGLSLWTYTAVWFWYLRTQRTKKSWPHRPWYPEKRTPSFADALASLRSILWRDRVFRTSATRPVSAKTTDALIEILARAA